MHAWLCSWVCAVCCLHNGMNVCVKESQRVCHLGLGKGPPLGILIWEYSDDNLNNYAYTLYNFIARILTHIPASVIFLIRLFLSWNPKPLTCREERWFYWIQVNDVGRALFVAKKQNEISVRQITNVIVNVLLSFSAETGVTPQPDHFSIAGHEEHLQSCKWAMCLTTLHYTEGSYRLFEVVHIPGQ